MGSSVTAPIEVQFKVSGIDAVRNGLRVVRAEGEAAGAGAQAVRKGISEVTHESELLGHSAVIGIGEFVRGISRIGSTGETSAFALRELSGGAMRLGQTLGGAGGLIGIAVLLGGAFYEAFSNARKQMEETRNKAIEELERIRQEGGVGGAVVAASRQQALFFSGQPGALRHAGESDVDFLVRSGGIQGVEARMAELRAKLNQGILNELESGRRTFVPTEAGKAAKEYGQLTDRLKELKSQHAAATKVADEIIKDFQGRTASGLGTQISTEAQKEGERLTNQAASRLDFAKVLGNEDFRNTVLNKLPGIRITPGTPGGGLLDALVGGFMGQGAGRGIAGPKIADLSKVVLGPMQQAQEAIARESARQIEALGEQIQHQFATTLGDSISQGIAAAFSSHSISAGFKAAGKAFLSGLGGLFVQIGEQALAGMALMKGIKDAILSFAPELGIPAAIGLIALGTVLQSAGASGGGSRDVSSGGGVTGPGSNVYGTISVDPRQRPNTANLTPVKPVTLNATIIGARDPQAQRELLEMIRYAQERT